MTLAREEHISITEARARVKAEIQEIMNERFGVLFQSQEHLQALRIKEIEHMRLAHRMHTAIEDDNVNIAIGREPRVSYSPSPPRQEANGDDNRVRTMCFVFLVVFSLLRDLHPSSCFVF